MPLRLSSRAGRGQAWPGGPDLRGAAQLKRGEVLVLAPRPPPLRRSQSQAGSGSEQQRLLLQLVPLPEGQPLELSRAHPEGSMEVLRGQVSLQRDTGRGKVRAAIVGPTHSSGRSLELQT